MTDAHILLCASTYALFMCVAALAGIYCTARAERER